jgi:hypothetical protein
MTAHRSTRRSQKQNMPVTRCAPGLASTAGALVAMVAVAAMMTSSAVAAPAARAETRQSVSEGAAVRAAVAAVAAAARHLVTGDRLLHAMPSAWSWATPQATIDLIIYSADERLAPTLTTLSERLLDLPPPVC